MDEKTLRFEVWDDANNRWAEATYPMTGEGTLSCIWKSRSYGSIKERAATSFQNYLMYPLDLSPS